MPYPAPIIGAVLGIVLVPHAIVSQDRRTVNFSLVSKTFGNTRTIRVHLPAGYRDSANAVRRYPVLYLNDGFAVFSPRAWNAPAIVDSLVAAGRIPPLILVGVDNAASIPGTTHPNRDRANEYLPYPDSTEPGLPDPQGSRFPEFMVGEVMPQVGRSFRVSGARDSAAIGGASHGGIAALYTVLKRPAVFGKLMLESTALFLFDYRLVEEARRLERWPALVYVGLGTQETDDPAILARARHPDHDFVALARQKLGPQRVLFHLVEGATHTSAAWRARFPVALQFLFPPRRDPR